MSEHTGYELFTPTPTENEKLQSLDDAYLNVSEMTREEREFLHALVLRHKPKKLLELGVSAGSSDVIILNAIKDIPNAKLHAVDYAKSYYMDKSKLTGFIVDLYPELAKQWQLYTGGLASQFMAEIGDGIDFCFIDTVHANPGELLDTLMVLPYLTDDAIIVYHDVNLHTFKPRVGYNIHSRYTNNLLISAVHGQKIIQGDFDWNDDPRTYFPNMAAVQLNKHSKEQVFEIFNLLTMKWDYLPTQKEEAALIKYFSQFYDEYQINYLKKVFAYQRKTPDYLPSPINYGKSLVKKILGPEKVNNYRAKKQTS